MRHAVVDEAQHEIGGKNEYAEENDAVDDPEQGYPEFTRTERNRIEKQIERLQESKQR